MAVPSEDSRIITRFLPSLAHLALVSVALPLLTECDIKTLKRVFTDIQHGISTRFNESRQKDRKAQRAQEKLLSIPEHLRHSVFKAVMDMHWSLHTWVVDHSCFNFRDISIYWGSDGTINRTITAQLLVRNESINIRERFDIACMHCLEKSVQTLWEEMEASGQTENFETGDKIMTSFWVRWLREESRVPWLQAVKEFLDFPPALLATARFRCSPFFPLLRPEDRNKFLTSLEWTCLDDFQLCLYAATKEEQVEILKKCAISLLLLYLNWPLQSFFFEIADKVWHFLDKSSFRVVLKSIRYYEAKRNDFYYCQLFVEFWNRCPNNLREAVRECPIMSKTIDSILNKIRRKRKKESISRNQKKWIRRNGRLEGTPRTS